MQNASDFLGRFLRHDPRAFLKVGESLAFLVRDAAHITPDNFDSCVECLRSYVEASLDGGKYVMPSTFLSCGLLS